uniref:Uncharacterized protein n=1 Tax=Anguilla anguilla TaxID=7936 RepID=A0A0E9VQP2_ANGAN
MLSRISNITRLASKDSIPVFLVEQGSICCETIYLVAFQDYQVLGVQYCIQYVCVTTKGVA